MKVGKAWILLAGVVVLALASAAVWLWRAPPTEAAPNATTLDGLERGVALLLTEYDYSKRTPLLWGATFPVLDVQVLRGDAPNWSRASVVTVGSSMSSFSLELHRALGGQSLQQLHIIARNPYLPQEVERFPPEVILLDGRDLNVSGLGPYPSISAHLNEALGLLLGGAYVIGDNRTILHAQVNRGNFAGVLAAAQAYLRGETPDPGDRHGYPIGQRPPLDALPQDSTAEVAAELEQPISLIFLSDKTSCSTCDNWLEVGEAFIRDWQARGYGLLLVEVGESPTPQRLPSGILRIGDPLVDGSYPSALMANWGVATIPNTFILKDGLVQGRMGWLELSVEGGEAYRDLHFRAVEHVLRTLEAAALPAVGGLAGIMSHRRQ